MAEYHVKVIKGTIWRVSADLENHRPVRITNCEHFCEIWYREILKLSPNAFIDCFYTCMYKNLKNSSVYLSLKIVVCDKHAK